METFGQYLRRNMEAKGITKQSDLEAILETFARHRFGFQVRFSQPSISQWLRDEKFPAEDKRRIIEGYFDEEYPLTAVIETMRRLLASCGSHAPESFWPKAS